MKSSKRHSSSIFPLSDRNCPGLVSVEGEVGDAAQKAEGRFMDVGVQKTDRKKSLTDLDKCAILI